MQLSVFKFAATTASLIFLPACTTPNYPKQNVNSLDKAVEFNYSHLIEPEITKTEAIAKAKADLERRKILIDSFANNAFDIYAPAIYNKLLSSQPNNELEFIRDHLAFSLQPYNILNTKRDKMRVTLRSKTIADAKDGAFEASFRYSLGRILYGDEGHPPEPEFTFDTVISGVYKSIDGITSGNFLKFSYTLDLNRNHKSNRPTPPSDVKIFVDETEITSELELFSSWAKYKRLDLVNEIAIAFQRQAATRYETSGAIDYPKFEKKFRIDFTSAKARLQRALGGFKYNDATSAFTLEQVFSKDGKIAIHKFSISLFPDRSDTIVQFSGNYQHISDSFGGPAAYDSQKYNQQMNIYAQQVATLLTP